MKSHIIRSVAFVVACSLFGAASAETNNDQQNLQCGNDKDVAIGSTLSQVTQTCGTPAKVLKNKKGTVRAVIFKDDAQHTKYVIKFKHGKAVKVVMKTVKGKNI